MAPKSTSEARQTTANKRPKKPRKKLSWRELEPDAVLAVGEPPEYVASRGDGTKGESDTWVAQWYAPGKTEPEKLGARKTPAGAKRLCEEHAAAQQGEDLGELGEWAIRVPPSQELKAALADKQADADEQICRLEAKVAVSAEAHKALKRDTDKKIEEVRERLRELRHEVRYGTTATRRCYRRRDGDEWVYCDEQGAELYREPACDGQQQRLVGKEAAPQPWGYDTHYGYRDRQELIAWLLDLPRPPEGPRKTSWPACELSWHPRVRWCQERLLGPGEDETVEVRQPRAKQPRPKLEWGKVPRCPIWQTKGSREYQLRIDLQAEPGRVLITAGHPRKPSEHQRLTSWQMLGSPAKAVKAAKAWCSRYHNRPRLEWAGDRTATVQLDTTGHYQLVRLGNGVRTASYVPQGEDRDVVSLGEHADRVAAELACQQYADSLWLEADEQRRAEG